MRLKSLLLAVVLLTGCPAVKSYKSGEVAEESGRTWDAAQHYLDSLDRRSGFDKPSLALERVATRAWEDGLAEARRRESDEQFIPAMEWYTALREYVRRVERHGRRDFEVSVDLDDKIEEMRAAAAFEAYSAGEDALQRRAWSTAIGHFEEAMRIAPGFKDSDARIAEARYRWADQEVDEARYRSAAERFETALSATGVPHEDAPDRAGELFAALGRFHLAAGNCRQAVRDLRRAAGRFPAAVAGDIEAAEACATVRVLIQDLGGSGNLGGIDTPTALSGAVRSGLPGRVSEFVVVLDPSARQRGTKAQEADFLVTGAVSEAWLRGPERTEEWQATSGRVVRACGEGEYSPCYADREVRYLRVRSVMSARAGAQIRIIDADTRGVLRELPTSASADSTLEWAQDFQDASGAAVAVGTSPTESMVAIDGSIVALRDAARAHPAPADLTRRILDRISDEMVGAISGVVDAERPWADPASLDIVTLRADASK